MKRHTRYTVQLDALALLVDWSRQMARFWENRFDDLETLLKGWTIELKRNACCRYRAGIAVFSEKNLARADAIPPDPGMADENRI